MVVIPQSMMPVFPAPVGWTPHGQPLMAPHPHWEGGHSHPVKPPPRVATVQPHHGGRAGAQQRPRDGTGGRSLRSCPMLRPLPPRDICPSDDSADSLTAVLDAPAHVLTSRIKDAGSLPRLHALSIATWPYMNSIHVSAFICKAARLLGCRLEPGHLATLRAWFRALLSEALAMRKELKPRELANIAWACAKAQQGAGHRGQPFVDPAQLVPLRDALHAHLPDMDAQGLANTLWSLSKLQVAVPREWLRAFSTALAPTLSRFNEQELANTLLGLSQAATAGDPGARAEVEHAARLVIRRSGEIMPDFSTQGLSNAIRALGSIGLAPPLPWADLFLLECTRKARDFTPQGLSNTLLGLGLLGVPPSPAFWAVARARILSDAPSFSPPAVTTTLQALAHLVGGGSRLVQPASIQDVVEALGARSSAVAAQLSPAGVASVFMALADMGCSPAEPHAATLAQRLADTSGDLSAADAVGVLGALTHPPPHPWPQSVEEGVLHALADAALVHADQSLGLTMMSSLVFALSTLQCPPNPAAEAELFDALAAALPGADLADLSPLLRGMASLGLPEVASPPAETGEAVAVAVTEALAGGGDLSPADAVMTLHALATVFPAATAARPVGERLVACANAHPSVVPFAAAALREHLDAADEAGVPAAPGAESAVKALAAALPSSLPRTPSEVHRRIILSCRHAGIPCRSPAIAPGGLHIVDALVTGPGGASFAVLLGSGDRAALDKLKVRQLSRAGVAVVAVPADLFGSAGAETPTRAVYLTQALHMAAERGEGTRGDDSSGGFEFATQGTGASEPPSTPGAKAGARDSIAALDRAVSAAPFAPRASGAEEPTTPVLKAAPAAERRAPGPTPFTPGVPLDALNARRTPGAGRTPGPGGTRGGRGAWGIPGFPRLDEGPAGTGANDENAGPGSKPGVTPTPVRVRNVLQRGGGDNVTPFAPVAGGRGDGSDRRTQGPHKSPLPMGRTPKPGAGRVAQSVTPGRGASARKGAGGGRREVAALSERASNVLDFNR